MDSKAKENLLVEVVGDETLVYDLDRHRAHCLNATAGFLLRSSDGTRGLADLATLAKQEFGAEVSEDVVVVGLERLRRAKLVEWSPAQAGGVSRREALKKLAVVGILLPTVMTLVSPYPAQAVTLIAPKDCNLQNVGKCCTNGKLCEQAKNGKYQCNGPGC